MYKTKTMDIFDKICRTCNNERKKMVNIFETKLLAKSKNIDEMLNYCVQAAVTPDDRYPKQICYFCAKQLEIAYKFIMQCNKSQMQFDRIIEYMETNCNDDTYSEEQEEPEQSLMFVIEEEVSVESKKENHVIDYEDQLYENVIIAATDADCAKSRNMESRKVFVRSDLTDSMQIIYKEECETTENEPTIACPNCLKKFFTAKALTLHQKLTHNNKNPTFETQLHCSNCNKNFSNKNLLALHRKYCTSSPSTVFSTTQNVPNSSSSKPN